MMKKTKSTSKKRVQIICLTVFFLASFAGPCSEPIVTNSYEFINHDSIRVSSPECERLIFTSFGSRYVASKNYRLQDLTLTPDIDSRIYYRDAPYLSQDGSRLVYASDCYRTGLWPFAKRNFEIFTSNMDGTDVRRITRTRSDELWPVWSPDSTRIAFLKSSEEGTLSRLYTIAFNGSDIKPVGHAVHPISLDPPAWSPDGNNFAFRNLDWDELYVVGSDDSYLQRVYEARRTAHNRARISAPVWSPDGGAVAFLVSGGVLISGGWSHDQWVLYTIDIKNMHIRSLLVTEFFEFSDSFPLMSVSFISWCADGSCIKVFGERANLSEFTNGDIRFISDGG